MYDGDDVVLSFDGAGSLTHRYLHGDAVDQVFASEDALGEVLWALTDYQGTVRDIADYDVTTDTLTFVNQRTFDSFGNITSESNPAVDFRYAYTGRFLDQDTGLQYNRGRWYDPTVGRWVSEDPIGFSAGDANLSRYVGNSPTNFVDPSGLDFIEVHGSIFSLGGQWASWQIEEDGFWANYNRDWWTLGDIKGGHVYLQDRWGGGSVPLEDLQELAADSLNHRDISHSPHSVQIILIREQITNLKRKLGQGKGRPNTTYGDILNEANTGVPTGTVHRPAYSGSLPTHWREHGGSSKECFDNRSAAFKQVGGYVGRKGAERAKDYAIGAGFTKAAGPLIGKLSKKAKLGKLISKAFHRHHPIPKFLSGNSKQVWGKRLSSSIHTEFHDLLRENLRNAGFPRRLMGGPTGSANAWKT